MNQKLMEDLGENYQYVKVIIDNKVKILKLKLIDKLHDSLGGLVLILISFVFLILLCIGLLIALSIWLNTLLNSDVLGFLYGFGILIPINIIIYIFRKPLIYNPIAKVFVNQFMTKENEEKESI